MSYYEPDLTGVDPAYRKDNDIYGIYKANQKIKFDIPIFYDSIIITKLGTINEVLAQGTDWIVASTDYAETESARMRAYDITFNKQLVSAITISKAYISQYKINIQQQRLYPVQIKKTLLAGNRLEVTPDTIGEMLESIEYLTRITAPITDLSASIDQAPFLLAEDQHKEITDNFVEAEEHEVNVPNRKNVIRPLGGSFYKDSVVVKLKDNPDNLVENTDYVIFGVDFSKTKMTSNTSGVYKYILILRDYVGIVEVTYHAYGGEVTVYDMSALNNQVNNLISFIENSTFLTINNIGQAPIIEALSDRVLALEDEVRRLYAELPSYGDVTTGSSSLLRITANDVGLHWYNLATLYKVDGSETVITADSMRFRLSTLNTKFMFEAIVTANLNNPNDPFTIDVLASNYPKGFIPFEDYAGLDLIIRPQLRIIYNDNEDQNSGVILQLGFELKGMIEESVAIEDLSGHESCWKLISVNNTVVTPNDDIVQLPNEDHVFDNTNEDSVAISSLVPFKDGFIIWAGSIPLNRPSGGSKSNTLEHILPDNVDLKRITKARVELKEVGGLLFPIDVTFIPGSEEATGIGYFSYNGSPAQISVSFWRTSGVIYFRIDSEIDPLTLATQLDLKHVFIFTS